MPRTIRLSGYFFLFSTFFFPLSFSFSQNNDTLNTDRLRALVFTGTSGYVASMVGLNQLWYSDFPRSSFHLFNDNAEWLQVDKAGHAMTSYYVGKLSMDALKWSGASPKKAMWYGGTFGLLFLTSVEMFDGLSTGWGFSIADMAANTAGVAFLFAQEKLWKEQKMLLKFSFSPSNYAPYRPNLLGSNFREQMLKDYNGQTYWLSVNITSFLHGETKFPKWLNAAFGYGADGMLGGRENPLADKNGNLYPVFKRERQYYFSLDVDLTRVKTKSKFMNSFLNAFGFLKFPAPAIEIKKGNIAFHPFYF